MLEFHVRSISPLHSKTLQLLWSSYIGLHKLRTPYAFQLSINQSLKKNIDAKKIIILDAETSNLPSRKLQPVNAYGTRNSFKKRYSAAIYFSVHFLHL